MSNGDFKAARKELMETLEAARKTSRSQLFAIAEDLRKNIIQKFYTNANTASVGRRTGKAAKSWAVAKIKDDKDGVVLSVNSSGVKYADFSRPKTIKPKSGGKYLVIPVGAGLTKAGVARYPGDANGRGAISQAENAIKMPPLKSQFGKRRSGDNSRSPLAWIKKDASTMLVVAKQGATGTGITKTNRLLFVLKTSVKIPAYTKGLMPYVNSFVDKRIASVSRSI